jgi:hypothetical protein
MGLTLAQTTFQTGISDSLAVVDVYTKNSASSQYTAIAKQVVNYGLFQAMVGKKTSADLILAQLKAAQSLAVTDIIRAVVAKNPQMQAAFSAAAPLLQQILSSPNAYTNSTPVRNVAVSSSTYKTVGVASTTTLSNAASADAAAIASMLESIKPVTLSTENYSFVDKSSQIALTTNMLCLAAAYNIPGAYSIAISKIEDSEIRTTVTKNILPTIVSTSNISMLADVASGPCAKTVLSSNPTFVSSYLSDYVKDDLANTNPARSAATIASCLNQIDKNWAYSTTSAGVKINNGNPVQEASSDLIELLLANNQQNRDALFTETTTGTSSSTLPDPASDKVARTISIDVNGNISAIDKYPNGKTIIYSVNPTTGDYDEVIKTPIAVPTDSASWSDFDNSKIDDPLVLLYCVDEACRKSKADKKDPAPMGANASTSLYGYFPYNAFSGIQDQYDVFY